MPPLREKPEPDVEPGWDCLALLIMNEEGRKILEYLDRMVYRVKVKDITETYGNAAKLELVQKIHRLAKMAYEKRMKNHG